MKLLTSQCYVEFSGKFAVFRPHVHLPANQDVRDTQFDVHAVCHHQFPARFDSDGAEGWGRGVQKEKVAALYHEVVTLLWCPLERIFPYLTVLRNCFE